AKAPVRFDLSFSARGVHRTLSDKSSGWRRHAPFAIVISPIVRFECRLLLPFFPALFDVQADLAHDPSASTQKPCVDYETGCPNKAGHESEKEFGSRESDIGK